MGRGVEKGKEDGIAEGISEGIRKTAAGMKSAGIPTATIATITGLSAEDIEAL